MSRAGNGGYVGTRCSCVTDPANPHGVILEPETFKGLVSSVPGHTDRKLASGSWNTDMVRERALSARSHGVLLHVLATIPLPPEEESSL
jgi:hypothetical protein